MLNRAAILTFDGQQRGPRGKAVSVGPMAVRGVDGAAFAGMLDGKTHRAAVGCELAAADLTTRGPARELLEEAAFRPARGNDETAIVRVTGIVVVADDPEPALRIDAEIVRAMNRADGGGVRITGKV